MTAPIKTITRRKGWPAWARWRTKMKVGYGLWERRPPGPPDPSLRRIVPAKRTTSRKSKS